MKLILAGYEKSKAILPSSSYLVNKYMKGLFDVYWINYGEYSGKLFTGQYIKLDAHQNGGSSSWSRYICEYLNTIDDELIVFGLDDYLISDYIDLIGYDRLLGQITVNESVVCARLCTSDFYKNFEELRHGMIMLAGENAYSATTQYCIWRLDFLKLLLMNVKTPWEFEIAGSSYLNGTGKKVIGMKYPVIKYPDSSSMSARWSGINVAQNNPEDIIYLVEQGVLNADELLR